MLSKTDLIADATAACNKRGHYMGGFVKLIDTPTRTTWEASCVDCGKTVHVDSNPPPNGIDISGEAVALVCTTI